MLAFVRGRDGGGRGGGGSTLRARVRTSVAPSAAAATQRRQPEGKIAARASVPSFVRRVRACVLERDRPTDRPYMRAGGRLAAGCSFVRRTDRPTDRRTDL